LCFILDEPTVGIVIPGMRKPANVDANMALSEAPPLSQDLHAQLRGHRWDRTPTEWSQWEALRGAKDGLSLAHHRGHKEETVHD
jgi:aryl-alcohol dehydrogenase-like predicted oxidoreductase